LQLRQVMITIAEQFHCCCHMLGNAMVSRSCRT
jgi:hypothetical protein